MEKQENICDIFYLFIVAFTIDFRVKFYYYKNMKQYNMYSLEEKTEKTILIIDNDAVNRAILRKTFSDLYTIREEPSGYLGIAEMLNNQQLFSAVLLDVEIPGMSGIEILRHMKQIGLVDSLPVFLITAEQQEHFVKEAYDLGVMDIIEKPVIPYLVRRRVQSVVELFETRKFLHEMVETQKVELMNQSNQILLLNQGMIEALATAIQFRDAESGGHVNRIFEITRFILENTDFGKDLSQTDINNIALASIMHDVGKIAIPDAVLTKPGKLTPEEFEIMKTHTTKGVGLLENIPQLQNNEFYEYACDIAWHHHERWDGKGYPEGLKGDEITPWSQVVALADVYDALSCKRVYKSAFSRKKVIEMIWAGQCGAFNPRLIDCFFSVEGEISKMYRNLEQEEESTAV